MINKILNKLFNEENRAFFGIGLGIIIALLAAFVLRDTFFFNKIENYTFDLRQKKCLFKKSDPNIVILDIDDNSLDYCGRWPWPRDRFADLIKVLGMNGCRDLMFDVEFLQISKPVIEVDHAFNDLSAKTRDFYKKYDASKQTSADAVNRGGLIANAFNGYINNNELQKEAQTNVSQTPVFLQDLSPDLFELNNLFSGISAFFYTHEDVIKKINLFFQSPYKDPDALFSESLGILKNISLAYHFAIVDNKKTDFFRHLQSKLGKNEPSADEITLNYLLKTGPAHVKDQDLAWLRREFRVAMIAEYLKDDINIENRYFYSFLSGTSNQVLSKEYDEDKNRPVNLTKEANRFFEKSRSNTAYMNEIIESARSAAVFRVAQQIMPQFISPDNRPDKTKIFKLLTEKIKWNSGYALISSKSIEQIIDRAAGLAVFEKNNSLNVINMSGLDLSGFMDPDIPSYTLSSRALLGYINAEPEADGVYRKVSLLKQYEGGFYPQLAMSALLAYLNFDFSKDSIVISPDRKLNIIVSDKKKYSIPLNENGEFFINWVPEVYENSFQHLSAAFLINYYDLLIQRIEQLSSLEAEFLPNFLGMTNIKSIYEKMISLRGRPGYEDSPEYQALLNKSRSFEKMLVSFIKRRVKKLSHIVNSIKDPNEAQEINNSVARLEKVLKSLDNRASYLKRAEEKIRKTVENKISIVGMSATSNTDIGAVPFQKNYPMCGTHANILNTIFTEQFIYTLPRGMELFFLVILGILTGFSIPKFKIANGAAFCIFQTFFYSVCAYLLFIKRFILIDLFTPLFVIFATYLLISVLRFIYEEKQKKFIKAAFGQYLAPVLVEQITKDPSKLRLGGERKICTSYFSDVAGFSTISEKLSPEELVSLLNEYLTAMTDIIIANKGTIDKYEGDAIIALFGAPVDYEDHAACACRASVEMQKLLVNMRAQWARQGKHELYVRMGLNSGPMVVGNMGSTQRMDYTMMGDTVNLAARLEGANKPYGTYTMISEYTYNMCSSLFDVRELDRIRVVGKKEPVTVYELLDNKNCLESKKAGVVELFLKGLELYKKCDWKGALKVFDRVLKLDPNDQPSRVYIQRCVEFIKTPPPKDWDGVYVLKSK